MTDAPDGDLARAIASVYMVYQPIIRWSLRRPYAVEALVRSSDTTLASAPELLQAAERAARLDDLGRRIRAQVAASAPAEGLLFVNLHPIDLLDDQLYDPCAPLSALAGRVVLEITEHAGLPDLQSARDRVVALRKLGYRIAIDDLGAGHADLASVTQLEPDVIKLDMSLVRDIDQEPAKQDVVRSIVELCTNSGLLMVGEGVETPRERSMLVGLGCDLMQGYLFARPSRERAVIHWPPDD
jgi:EAL domain-containing protein (putative c-di-GMP-specific phosphodiesterase class I)